MKKRIISLILCFLLFINIGFCFSVSAAGDSSSVLSFIGESSISNSDLNNLYSNSTFTRGCLFVRYTGFSTYSGICNLSNYYHESSGGWDYYCNYNPQGVRVSSYNEFSSSSTLDINFSSITNNVSEAMIIGFSSSDFIICYTDSSFLASNSLSSLCQTSSPDNNDYWHTLPPKRPILQYAVVYPVNAPFDVSYESVNLPFFSLDVDSFYDWIINNNKLVELPVYITQAKLKSFLEFYKSFGSSNTFFISKIADWFSHMNIANQSMSNISALKQATDKLYQEYINYRSGTHAYWPNATKIQERDDIDTKTDNNNVTLVTDDANDSLDISILRDILRGVIAISNNVNQGCANIVQKLDELNFIVNVVNDGGDNSPVDLSSLYLYDADAFTNDLQNFEASIEDVQNVPQGYIDTINQNSLMPENMLEDKNSLTVNVPTIAGFTVGGNGSTYSTQTGSYVLRSSDYPWLDTVVQKIKRFASILLILGYLVHLRYRIPELIRGE